MKTILLVEDDRQYREILHKTLEKEGYVMFTAENGRKGLDIIEKKSVDLILLDIIMPDMDGIGFYYNLTHVMKKHIPIIVLTNLSDTKAYGKDIKDILIKANISLADVVKTVKETI